MAGPLATGSGNPVTSPTFGYLQEATFANSVAKETGLDPRVVFAWATVENAYAPGGTGGFNYLNLRPAKGDVGVTGESSGGFDQFGNVQDAIQSTVNRLHNPFASQILASAGSTPAQEISAIAASGWDAGHYGGAGGPNLQAAFNKAYGSGAEGLPAASPSTTSVAAGGSAGGSLSASGVANTLTGGLYGDATKFFDFVTSWRFAEIVGGALLLLVGLLLVGRSLGVSVPSVTPAQKMADYAQGKTSSEGGARQYRNEPRITAGTAYDRPRRPRPAADYGEVPF